MPTVQFNANFMVSHRTGDGRDNCIRQGYNASTDTPISSGDNSRWTGHWGYNYASINSTLNGMIIDSITMSMTSTIWGISNAIELNIYKSPFKASASGSRLDPDDYLPASDIYQNGTTSYFQTPDIARNQTVTFELPADYLQHIRDGYLLACYRRLAAATPTTSHYTREFTEAPILSVTYHAPISTFSLSTSSLDAGQNITVNIDRADSTYTHTVTFNFGSATPQVYTGIATSKVHVVPLEWLYQIPNSLSGTATCVVKTYNSSGTLMGEAPAQYFTVTVPANVKPYISLLTPTVVDGYAGGLYVKGYSKVQLTASGISGAYWSSIVSYSIGGGSTNPYTTGILYTPGTNTFYATVTDSRGRVSDPVYCTISVTDYSPPNVSNILLQRVLDTGGTLNDEGTYCKVTPTYSWSAIGTNARDTAIYVRELPSGSFYSVSGSLLASGGYIILGPGYAIDKAYEIRFTVDDSISGPVYGFATLYTAKYIMDYKAGGDGVAFGQVSTRKGVEVAGDWPFYANGERIGTPSNENFLINTNFKNIVNQRGYINYANVTSNYTIDRWYMQGTGHIAIAGDYAHLYNTAGSGYVFFLQRIEFPWSYLGNHTLSVEASAPSGADCGMAIIDNAGTWIASKYFTAGGGWQTYSTTVNIPSGKTALTVWIFTNTNVAFRNPKLEYGTVLTPYVPKSYMEELAACQRYYQKFYNTRFTYSISSGDQHYFTGNYVFPTTMRTSPTVTVTGSVVLNVGTPSTSAVDEKNETGIFQTRCTLLSVPETKAWHSVGGYADAEIY